MQVFLPAFDGSPLLSFFPPAAFPATPARATSDKNKKGNLLKWAGPLSLCAFPAGRHACRPRLGDPPTCRASSRRNSDAPGTAGPFGVLEPHLLLISNLGWPTSLDKQLSQLRPLRSSPDAEACQPAWLPAPENKILHLCPPTLQLRGLRHPIRAFSLFKPRSLDVSSTVAFTRACKTDRPLFSLKQAFLSHIAAPRSSGTSR